MEFVDDYLSDTAIQTLEIITYLGAVGSYKLRDKIIYNGRGRSITVLGERRNYRIFVDNIVSDIIDYFTDIDKDIIDNIILEAIENTDNKNLELEFAKFYDFNKVNNKVKRRDDIFKIVKVNQDLYKFFVETSKKNKIKTEDFFKIGIIRFLEKRYDIAVKIQRDLADNIFPTIPPVS